MRIISWNLLRRIGASAHDVAQLIQRHQPDLVLMQEATEDLRGLPAIVGGVFFHQPLDRRIYGLAAWSRHPMLPPFGLPLPASAMPGRVPPRVAQIVRSGEVTLANVHLSHGQFLNRFQLLRLVQTLGGRVAIIGDYNAVGPVRLDGLRDVGPRESTHAIAGKMKSFRLDRCMVRGLVCTRAGVLDRGSSDHHPIMVDLAAIPMDTEMSRRRLFEPTWRAHQPRLGGFRVPSWFPAPPRRQARRGAENTAASSDAPLTAGTV